MIHHGILRKDIYLPLSVITGTDADGIHLSITKHNALHVDWRSAPPVTLPTPSTQPAPRGEDSAAHAPATIQFTAAAPEDAVTEHGSPKGAQVKGSHAEADYTKRALVDSAGEAPRN